MAEPQRRQARAERTRTRIINIAAAAFAEHGYDRVSFTMLIDASRLSKGAFYFHFSSKEELALTVFLEKQQQLLGRLRADDTGSERDAADRLRSMLRRRNRLLVQDPSLACVTRLGNEMSARSAPGSPYAYAQDRAIDLIAEVVEAGQRGGDFRPEIDPQAAARSIFAWVVGVDALSLSVSGGKDLQDRSEEMLALLMPALLAEPHCSDGVPAATGRAVTR